MRLPDGSAGIGGRVSWSLSLDFSFSEAVSVAEVLRGCAERGFSFSREGRIAFVLDDGELFDWQDADEGSLRELMDAADRAAPEGTVFAITVFLDESGVGGELLFHRGRRDVSFLATVHRRRFSGGSEFSDVGWYVERLVPVMEPLGLSEVEVSDSR